MSTTNQGQSGVLGRVASAALTPGPVQTWQAAREGTQQLASMLPESDGLGRVKHFIQRHPVVCAGTALMLGYFVLGGWLPTVGRAYRVLGGRG